MDAVGYLLILFFKDLPQEALWDVVWWAGSCFLRLVLMGDGSAAVPLIG